MSSAPQPAAGAEPIPMGPVVEFGPDPDERVRRPRRRWNPSGAAGSLLADRRLVPVAAALSGVALFASLISEWQVTAVDTAAFGGTVAGNRPIPSDLGDLGGWAAGYLAGLVVLVGAVVLVMFGPPAGRAYARLLGLSTGGVLLGLLLALEPTLDETSRTIGALVVIQLDADQVELSAGRGIWCAFFGVLAALAALYLAGRHLPAAGAGHTVTDGPGDTSWSWRRPTRAGQDEDPLPDEPFDLSVAPAKPFTSLSDDRDRS